MPISTTKRNFNFTSMLTPCCIVMEFLLNNQPDAIIIQIYCYKTTCFEHLLCPSSGVFYCIFGTGKFHAGLMIATEQSQDGTNCAWKRSSNLHETYQCRMYGRKLLMMGREDARNMQLHPDCLEAIIKPA